MQVRPKPRKVDPERKRESPRKGGSPFKKKLLGESGSGSGSEGCSVNGGSNDKLDDLGKALEIVELSD